MDAPALDRTVTAANAPRCAVRRRRVVAPTGEVVGYALTLTEGTGPAHGADPADAAGLHPAWLALDLPGLVGDHAAFVPATPQMLDGELPAAAADLPGRVVLVLPTGFEESPDAAARAARLRASGVRIALDRFRATGVQVAFLTHVDAVLVRPGDGPLVPLVAAARRAGVQVVSLDVPDGAAEDQCRAAGVDALAAARAPQPDLGVAAHAVRAGETQCLTALRLLHVPEVDYAAVARAADADPIITVRMLHLVNNAAVALRREVDTAEQACVLLGVRELVVLVAALLLDARRDAMDCLWHVLSRALTCEALTGDPAAYTAGMLSALAEELGVAAGTLLGTVGVSDTVRDAVLAGAGPIGAVLTAVRAHEDGDAVAVLVAGLLPADVSATSVRAVAEALATARAVSGAP